MSVSACVSGRAWIDAMAGIFGPQPSEKGEDGGELLLLERGGSPRGCLHPESKKKKNLAHWPRTLGLPKRHTAEAGDELRKKKRRSSEELKREW